MGEETKRKYKILLPVNSFEVGSIQELTDEEAFGFNANEPKPRVELSADQGTDTTAGEGGEAAKTQEQLDEEAAAAEQKAKEEAEAGNKDTSGAGEGTGEGAGAGTDTTAGEGGEETAE